jgi:hypothetical protein
MILLGHASHQLLYHWHARGAANQYDLVDTAGAQASILQRGVKGVAQSFHQMLG